jgi:CheY-like chemotaxis protein
MSIKVLVFESDPAFAGELRSELAKLGCTTTVVDDGNAGLQQATADRPDLILLSIELPRMNGFSVCNKLKKDPSLKDVPLIIMSSESSDETFEQHKKLRTRAEDYVHKPIAFGELLQHIQGFVALGTPASTEGEGAFVIDDEIEIGGGDYVAENDSIEMGARSPPPSAAADAPRGIESIDADVDAFAESAFGRLTGPDAPSPLQTEARKSARNGASEALVAAAAVRRSTGAPPPLRAPSVRPPNTIEIAEYERVREDLARARHREGASDRALREAQSEVEKLRLDAGEAERLRAEVDELRARLAASATTAKTGAISSREFLDLREALNRKDKEILTLKEQLSKKDRESVELQDRQLGFERTKADLDERLLAVERELTETRERNETLAADRDLAKKVSEDNRARLEKARAEVEVKERLLAEVRSRHADELSAKEIKLATWKAELDQTLANERAEHARALDQTDQRRKADLEEARREREASLMELREQMQRERQEALAARSTHLERERDARIGALQRAHEGALGAIRREADEKLTVARREADEKLAEVRAEAEKHELAASEALRAEHAEAVRALENDRDARLAAVDAKATRELGEASERVATLDADLSATRGELTSLREAKSTDDAANAAKVAELEQRLGETQAAREDLEKRVASGTERMEALEAELATARKDLAETKERLVGESSRADKAVTKWDADRQSLERAKDALAVALSQIEEAESRPIR